MLCDMMRSVRRRGFPAHSPCLMAAATAIALARILPVLVLAESSMDNVYLTSSYGQLVASSTLRWTWTNGSTTFFRDPRVLKLGEKSLCRGWHQNRLAPGNTDSHGRCLVGFFHRVHVVDSYQVMVDISEMARLEWQAWDMFTKIPVGTVAFLEKDALVARHLNEGEGQTYTFGDLNPRRGLSGDIAIYHRDSNRGSEVQYLTKGDILVEVEPVRYQLEDVTFITRRAKVHKAEIHLGSRTLSNDILEEEDDNAEASREDTSMTFSPVRAVIAYNATYRYYWGQVPGLIRSLPASSSTMFGQANKKIGFRWGMPLVFTRHRILEVNSHLLPGTSVRVSAAAWRTTTEVPYTAKLVFIFPDGKERKKMINGTYLETVLSDVSTDFGRPYFTHNGTAAPTTTTTTTAPRPTTSSTTTTAFTSSSTPSTQFKPRSWQRQLTMSSGSRSQPRTSHQPRDYQHMHMTEENPLRRFYPTNDDTTGKSNRVDGAGHGFEVMMQSDQAKRRNLALASPASAAESLVISGARSAHGLIQMLVVTLLIILHLVSRP